MSDLSKQKYVRHGDEMLPVDAADGCVRGEQATRLPLNDAGQARLGAAQIRRGILPYDEYPSLARPGGECDQLEAAIAKALEAKDSEIARLTAERDDYKVGVYAYKLSAEDADRLAAHLLAERDTAREDVRVLVAACEKTEKLLAHLAVVAAREEKPPRPQPTPNDPALSELHGFWGSQEPKP